MIMVYLFMIGSHVAYGAGTYAVVGAAVGVIIAAIALVVVYKVKQMRRRGTVMKGS